MTPQKTVNIHLRVDEETEKLLRRLAEKERETLSNYIRRLLWKQVTPKNVYQCSACDWDGPWNELAVIGGVPSCPKCNRSTLVRRDMRDVLKETSSFME